MSDKFKNEVYTTLQSMGYNYVMVDIAYKRAPIKTTEGVLNYIMENPSVHSEAEQQITSNSGYGRSSKSGGGRQPKIDTALKGQLLIMGLDEAQIDAALTAPGINTVDKALDWIASHPDAGKKKTSGRPKKGSRNTRTKKTESGRTKKPPSRRNDKRIGGGRSRKTKEVKKPERKKEAKKTTGGGTKLGNYNESGKTVPDVEFGVYNPHAAPKVVEDSNLKFEKTKAEKEREAKALEEKNARALRKETLRRAKARERENKRNPPPKPEPEMEEAKPKKNRFSKKSQGAKINKIVKNEKSTPNLSLHELERIEKEKQKQEILKQLAIDKARRFGKEVEIEEYVPTTEDHFLEIYRKMESIYPIRTPKAKKLKTCLKTIGIYLSKKIFIFNFF